MKYKTPFKRWVFPSRDGDQIEITIKRLAFLATLHRLCKQGHIYADTEYIAYQFNKGDYGYTLTARTAGQLLAQVHNYGGARRSVHAGKRHFFLNPDNIKHMLIAARSFISFIDEALDDE